MVPSHARSSAGARHREALDRFVAEALARAGVPAAVRRTVTAEVLERVSGDLHSSDPDQLALYIAGALCDTVERHLGSAAADAMKEVIAELTARNRGEESGVIDKDDLEPSTIPAPRVATVLLLSGDSAKQQSLRAVLEQAGYAVQVVDDARRAVTECSFDCTDVVVADLELLDVDAATLSRLFVAAHGHRAPRLLVLAARRPASLHRAVFQRLPCGAEELTDAVAQLAAETRQRRSGTTPVVAEPPASSERAVPAPSPFRRIIEEALDKVASVDFRDDIVAYALQQAGLAEVPTDPGAANGFVHRSVRGVVEMTLGADAADAVMEDLAPILQQAEVTSGVCRTSPPPDDGAVPQSARATDAPAAARAAARRRVVVAIADAELRAQVSQLLRARDLAVLPVPQGHAALVICAKRDPVLVIVEPNLPAVSGPQLAASLRVMLGDAAPPVVFLAADVTAWAQTEGVAAVLPTPVEPEALGAAVERWARSPSPRKGSGS